MLNIVIYKKTKDINGNTINHVKLFCEDSEVTPRQYKFFKYPSILKNNKNSLSVYPQNLESFIYDIEGGLGYREKSLVLNLV